MHPHLTHRPRRMVIYRCGLPPLALEPRIARNQFPCFIFFWRGRRYLDSGPHWRFCGALTGAAEERSGKAAQDRRRAKRGSALKIRKRPGPHRHRLSKRQKAKASAAKCGNAKQKQEDLKPLEDRPLQGQSLRNQDPACPKRGDRRRRKTDA